jgi:hypothetical protein
LAIKRKTHRQLSLAMGLKYADTKKVLGQQAPEARRHGCAATTQTATSAAVLALIQHYWLILVTQSSTTG